MAGLRIARHDPHHPDEGAVDASSPWRIPYFRLYSRRTRE
jgi:hypothetical protein